MDPTSRRRLGRTSLELSRFGLGTAPLAGFGRPVPGGQAVATVRAALAAGVNYVDTAPFYGHGLSEHRVGEATWNLPRAGFVLSTKVGRLLRPLPEGSARSELFAQTLPFEVAFDYGYDATRRSLEDSLQRLGHGRIDIALIHDVNPRWHGEDYDRRFDDAMAGCYRALDELRAQGAVAAIGVGVNDWRVCLRSAEAGRFDCFMLAGRYTLLDQSALDAFLPYCAEHGIGVLLAGPFNSGILATGAVAGATFFYQSAPPEIRERTRRLEDVCARHDVPLAAAALQFPLGHAAVTSVVTGCSSPDEVATNLALARHPVPPALWDELKAEGLIPHGAPTP